MSFETVVNQPLAIIVNHTPIVLETENAGERYPLGVILEALWKGESSNYGNGIQDHLYNKTNIIKKDPKELFEHAKKLVQNINQIKMNDRPDWNVRLPQADADITYEKITEYIDLLARIYADKSLKDILHIQPNGDIAYEQWKAVIDAIELKLKNNFGIIKAHDISNNRFKSIEDKAEISTDMIAALGYACEEYVKHFNLSAHTIDINLSGLGLSDDHFVALSRYFKVFSTLNLEENKIELKGEEAQALARKVLVGSDEEFVDVKLAGNPIDNKLLSELYPE